MRQSIRPAARLDRRWDASNIPPPLRAELRHRFPDDFRSMVSLLAPWMPRWWNLTGKRKLVCDCRHTFASSRARGGTDLESVRYFTHTGGAMALASAVRLKPELDQE